MTGWSITDGLGKWLLMVVVVLGNRVMVLLLVRFSAPQELLTVRLTVKVPILAYWWV